MSPSESLREQAEDVEGGVHRLKVYVASNDQSLNLQTDESYALTVSAPTSTLEVSIAINCAKNTSTLPSNKPPNLRCCLLVRLADIH